MTTHEQDIRVQLLNTFLTTPHRKLEELAPLHTSALERDPLFYAHLAPWYFAKGEVRDHRTLFVAHLATSDFPEFREEAWMLLQQLAPFEVARVLDHSKRVIGKTPRSLRSAIMHYLRTREKHEKQFDGAALRAQNDLKHLYASLRIKPSPRAQAILFDRRPPEESPLAALKRLAKAESAEEQAAILLEHNIPYTTAIGAIKHLTPALLVAIITTMTPQEVINNLAALKRRGAMDDAEVKALITQKIAEAATDARVSTMKTKKAREIAKVDEETERVLKEVTDQRIASKVEIKRSTALFVDKSGSMARAIEVAKQLAALISAVIHADFHVYAFDSAAFEIKTQAKEKTALSDWEEAFKFIKADGATSIGAALAKMTRESVYAEQLLIVTDEGENTAPLLVDAWDEYRKNMHTTPSVIIIQVEGVNERFAAELQRRGVEVIRYQFRGDTYSLPNILPLLAMPSRAELVEMIMQYEMPKRPKPGGQTA
ncbi:MAG TPA: vWA domain-containing protein [Ktedonobacteraceae bacterium]|nr:vWA domain-containing protein [Ktedonobacteraceae bacterium]